MKKSENSNGFPVHGIFKVSYGLLAGGAGVRYACGHRDSHVTVLKVPECLYAVCRERGWLTVSPAWGPVVAMRHARADALGFRRLGFKSDECSNCLMQRLKRELDALGTVVALESSLSPRHGTPLRGAKHPSIRHA